MGNFQTESFRNILGVSILISCNQLFDLRGKVFTTSSPFAPSSSPTQHETLIEFTFHCLSDLCKHNSLWLINIYRLITIRNLGSSINDGTFSGLKQPFQYYPVFCQHCRRRESIVPIFCPGIIYGWSHLK